MSGKSTRSFWQQLVWQKNSDGSWKCKDIYMQPHCRLSNNSVALVKKSQNGAADPNGVYLNPPPHP